MGMPAALWKLARRHRRPSGPGKEKECRGRSEKQAWNPDFYWCQRKAAGAPTVMPQPSSTRYCPAAAGRRQPGTSPAGSAGQRVARRACPRQLRGRPGPGAVPAAIHRRSRRAGRHRADPARRACRHPRPRYGRPDHGLGRKRPRLSRPGGAPPCSQGCAATMARSADVADRNLPGRLVVEITDDGAGGCSP
jgi:hypothetical protein